MTLLLNFNLRMCSYVPFSCCLLDCCCLVLANKSNISHLSDLLTTHTHPRNDGINVSNTPTKQVNSGTITEINQASL